MRDLDRDLRDTVGRMTAQTYIDCNKNMYMYTIRVSSVGFINQYICDSLTSKSFGIQST